MCHYYSTGLGPAHTQGLFLWNSTRKVVHDG